MQIRISTRHGSISEATQAKIQAKVEKLNRYFERLSEISVTIDLERRDEPSIDLKVSAEHKHDFVATVKSTELMAGVDQVLHKLEQQLRKYKEKIQDRHRNPAARQQAAEIPQETDE